MSNLYFCLIPYYIYYDSTEAPDIPECMNFLPIDITDENGDTHELMFGALTSKRQLPRAIVNAAESEKDGFVSNATVVFCAKADTGAIVTIGWYSHCNVTPVPELLPMTTDTGEEISHPFFFCTRRCHATLLPEDERFKPQWQIPRNKTNAKGKFGFSADTVWCAEEPAAASFVRAFVENIAWYEQNGENMLFPTEKTDSDILE